MPPKKSLFENDESDEDIHVLKINKPYADKYSEWRIKEELQALKGCSDLEVESSSESSSEDEESCFKNRQFALDYYLTLGSLSSKNPKHRKRYFKESYDEPKKQKEEKPLRLAEYQRNLLIQKKGNLSDEEESDEEKPAGYLIKGGDRSEQKAPKKFAFQDDISDDEGEMFTKKEKAQDEAKDDKNLDIAEEAVFFIRGQIDSMKNKEHQSILQNLKDEYHDPDRDEKEKWLDDFFMNNVLHPDSEYSDDNCIEDKETLSEDEETYRKMQEFDTLFRFRYEQDNDELIKNYPRLTVNSSKIKENKRRKKRIEIKERKKREKLEKIREYRTLKAMDLDIKLKKLQKSAGFGINIGQEVLDDAFDPERHSQLMDGLFNDEYYEENDGEVKPVFEDNDNDIYGDYDEWLEKNGEIVGASNDGGECSGIGKEHTQGDNNATWEHDNVEEKADEEPRPSSSRRRQPRSKFAEALKRKKGIFDPRTESFDTYYKKHYGLECEDFIGDMPVKFKYRTVPCNNYGLNTCDVFQATDGELNQWVSWKKIAQYERNQNEEKTEHIRYKIKAQNADKMKQILPSLFEDPNAAYANEEEKKRNKYEKKKARKQRHKAALKRKRRHGEVEDNDDAPRGKKAKIEEIPLSECNTHKASSSTQTKTKQINAVDNQVAECSSKKKKLVTNIKIKSESKQITAKQTKNEKGTPKTVVEKSKSKKAKLADSPTKSDNVNGSMVGKSGSVKKAKSLAKESVDLAKNKKLKKNKVKADNEYNSNITDLLDESRLAAFNLNPKKAVKRIKHWKKK